MALPPAAGRCPTCGHEAGDAVVVLVGEEPAPSPQPDGGRRDADSGARGRRVAVAVVAALGLAVAALVAVDGKLRAGEKEEAPAAEAAEETTTSRRPRRSRPPRTTVPITTTTLGLPPLALGEPTGLRLLAFSDRGTYRVDLDAGTIEEWSGGLQGYGPPVPVGGGFVVLTTLARFVTDLTFPNRGRDLGPANQALSSDVTGRAWLMETEEFGGGRAREVEVATLQTTAAVDLPDTTYVVGVVTGGLVVSGPDGTYLWDRERGMRRLTRGRPIAAGADAVVTHECDEALRCYVALYDIGDDEGRELPVPATPVSYAAISPDERHVAISPGEPDNSVLVYDVREDEIRPGPSTRSATGSIHWSPNSQWLVWVAGPEIVVFNPVDSAARALTLGSSEVVLWDVLVLGPAG